VEIERPTGGDLYKNFGLLITKDGEKISDLANCEIRVQERKLTRTEAEELFEQAILEIDKSVIGENRDANHINTDINLQNSYVNGGVLADWSLGSYDYLSMDGTYNTEAARGLDEIGELVEVKVNLNCQDYSREYEFYLNVIPPVYSLEDSIKEEIQQIVNRDSGQQQVVLPESVVVNGETYALEWSKASADSPLFIIIAIAMAIIFIRYEMKERKAREIKREKIRLQLEYPEIVSEFALLLGAGMNIRTVLKELSRNGEHEELERVIRDVENGYSEYQAFYRMADRCDLKCYRRFASLITQNIMLGGRHLSKMLLKESERAYEERKNLAIKMGEEAGTKMMIPMFLMLGIVLTVTILPAFFSMNI